jgi:VWFA-related protein
VCASKGVGIGEKVGEEGMLRPLQSLFVRRTAAVLLLAWLAAHSPRGWSAQAPPAQDSQAKSDTIPQTPAPAPPPSDANNASEVSTHDNPATFKVRVNLVLVRVVVRDNLGKVVTGLKKEDFQLTDNRKPQIISTFSIERPDSHKLAVTTAAATTAESGEPSTPAAPVAALPQRFVAVMFDDTNMLMQDTTFVRDAASRLFGALAPTDRVGIFSTSGQLTQDFTQDHESLKNVLLRLVPRPVAGAGFHECPDVSYYQADLIVNRQDPQALGVATADALACAFGDDPRMTQAAQQLAQSTSQRVVSNGDAQTEYVYRHLEDVIRRLSVMPGQRVLVLVSPGFILTTMTTESSDLVDRANRSNIVINTIDARGLYTPDLMGDISDPPQGSFRTGGYKSTYRIAAQMAQEDILAQLADGTGGTFFHNRNDVDEGLRQATAAPAVSYLIGFSPQNLKIDGHYHTLKVVMANKQKYSVQARHGYFAPRTIADPAEAAKQEIQEALFSQDEIHDLPVELQTQFFKKDEAQARLAVLTHVDVKGIRFRKTAGRNLDNLTVATAIFDENGNFVTGGEKIVEMRLLDKTFDRLSHSGFTLKSSFDIKPGTYLVRLVVRDAEGSQMAARNGAVIIPF